MASQNFPIQENVNLSEDVDPRIPHIVEQRLAGKSWSNIGRDIDLTRRAIYDIRHKDDFKYYVQILFNKAEKVIDELLDSDKPQIRLEAAKEVNRMRRALIPKQIEKREQKAEIIITMHDTFQPPKKVEATVQPPT